MTSTTALPTTEWFPGDFFRIPVLAVLRGLSLTESVRLSERAWDAGVQHVEIPIQTSDAVPVLKAVAEAAAERGLVVGAGTVTNLEQLDAAEKVGVAFTVSPGFSPEIVAESVRRGIPHLPGVATATEILQARALGLRWVKVFPASILGPNWAKSMKGPYPDMNFIATGGVTALNAPDFLSSGVSVVGLSSSFADDAQLELVRGLIAASAASVLTGAGRK
ncbi:MULTISPECIES: bifunctional 4-hydroxy-2-oxoglutarate aldolase/2-dehydro-3-deoxy-phosphogluconate aldolase [unclassified Cryobacterium]|jgi:2-dehydro-3-deoxyphosphogluconate aldolase/(4S)-4-hydroxy-2-oxoglutarate aldolase|uniref:bifunctional 4-hydroxy-2-oxoglutarate aldolase/2-dehydro-3-deoxy-phosphogluconate aldolase n=1 Tax=unclassified Cryobacterium TaxID=2649013 RepID=UPI002AB40902|nr:MULTISPECIES: bifunctional 4-hydroxy-2-oxoglutarate aldolase/2-dehydro-3-deoxy-phosphogluconate aldolase [unclassified Cryobacterium]MDY7541104.1 bifunctional 4-hydroxy-2-oxoglutarate aldolase/2-dehydro-3-deoxy-phosphogluconate aldolase [Cryobacterium sp. 5B3]MEA9999937.1 bifunctional 4-hydroxy-2-oxoglutarate aldolase/2-dehydro-3-deoxy-phosphogluconate aldolase [Cryobacterium sp. RTS3]MEB0266302.1 bifunctional 4-hydroxy-2-oxoglutarate aldolase/2-dehydro-3-deoxy-phosphogluconate aldolase [Cryo